MLSSKLEIKKLRFQSKSYEEDAQDMFTTQYTNSIYTIYINEKEEGVQLNINSNDPLYPNIYTDGMKSGFNVPATGTLSFNELQAHIERLNFAKDTYQQAVEFVKRVKSR